MTGPWPFVGRTDELRSALGALHGTDAGGGVLFGGAPGVGRTRALRALVEGLDPERHVVVRAFGSRATSGIHLGALAHLLPPGELTASDPQRLLGRAFDLLRRDASGRRTVLAVDDIHHLDPLGAAFVHSAVRGEVATLAATACTGEPMPAAVATLLHDDVVTEVSLAPLRHEDVRGLLESLLAGPVEPESCQRGDVDRARAAVAEARACYRPTMAIHGPAVELADLQTDIVAGLAGAESRARNLSGSFASERLHGYEMLALHTLTRLRRAQPDDAERLAALAAASDSPFAHAAAEHARAQCGQDPDALQEASCRYRELGLNLFAVEAALEAVHLLLARRAPGGGAAAARLLLVLDETGLTPHPHRPLPIQPLTRRETDVAARAAGGRPARSIAQELFIGTRTVESTLRRAYRKLGIRTRDDLAPLLALAERLRGDAA
jgi:DNA-binding CsgD family transcriptional regulator